jgi:hypothetical protein
LRRDCLQEHKRKRIHEKFFVLIFVPPTTKTRIRRGPGEVQLAMSSFTSPHAQLAKAEEINFLIVCGHRKINFQLAPSKAFARV